MSDDRSEDDGVAEGDDLDFVTDTLIENAQTALRGGEKVQVLLGGAAVRIPIVAVEATQADGIVGFTADDGVSSYLVRSEVIAGFAFFRTRR